MRLGTRLSEHFLKVNDTSLQDEGPWTMTQAEVTMTTIWNSHNKQSLACHIRLSGLEFKSGIHVTLFVVRCV